MSFEDIDTEWNSDLAFDGMAQDGALVSAEKKLEGRALTMYRKNLDIHYNKVSELEDIAPLPEKGEHHVIITEKQFNAFALILRLIEEVEIKELYLAIYRINKPTVNALIALMENGRIKKGRYVISSFFNQTKRPEKWARKLRQYCDKSDRFEHIYTHNHAKVLACRTADMNHYVFEGSGNMSDNARIEQYRYENNKESYQFHKKWMKNLVDNAV